MGGLGGAESFAFAFEEHEQAGSDLVVRGDDQFASGSDDAAFGEFDFHDPGLRLGIAVSRRHRDQNSRRGTLCQINYGGLLQLLK